MKSAKMIMMPPSDAINTSLTVPNNSHNHHNSSRHHNSNNNKYNSINSSSSNNAGTRMTILPLGGGQEVGRSCILISYQGRNVILDCGIHPGKRGVYIINIYSVCICMYICIYIHWS